MVESLQQQCNTFQDRVQALMHWDKTQAEAWMETNNPLLGGLSPETMVYLGSAKRLQRFIDQAEAANHLPPEVHRESETRQKV